MGACHGSQAADRALATPASRGSSVTSRSFGTAVDAPPSAPVLPPAAARYEQQASARRTREAWATQRAAVEQEERSERARLVQQAAVAECSARRRSSSSRRSAMRTSVHSHLDTVSPGATDEGLDGTSTCHTVAAGSPWRRESLLGGRYRLDDAHIGDGGFGKVYAATDVVTGERVAVKRIQKEFTRRMGKERQVRQEIAAMARLDHRAVVRLLDDFETEDDTFLVMELCSGDMYDHVKQHKLPEAVAREYFRDMVAGLQHCHSQGVYHLDIKPENLLIDWRGQVKIADFGISEIRLPAEGDTVRTVEGSSSYMAPEAILCKAHKRTCYSGAAADVWSAGVALYVMVARTLPFKGKGEGKIRTILDGRFAVPANISPELQDLLMRMLHTDPRARCTLAEVAAHPWLTAGAADQH